MPPLITGDIKETSGLYDALNRVKDLNISCGVLRIAADDFIGLIGIAEAERIVGAVTKDGNAARLTDNDAVDKLLAMKHGTFEFYEVPQNELTRLDQSLALDIGELLLKRVPVAVGAEAAAVDPAGLADGEPELQQDDDVSASGDDAIPQYASDLVVENSVGKTLEAKPAEFASEQLGVGAELSETESAATEAAATESELPALGSASHSLTASFESPPDPDEPKSEKRVSTLLAKFTEPKPSQKDEQITKLESGFDPSALDAIVASTNFDAAALDSIGTPAKVDAAVLDSIKAPEKFNPVTDDLSVSAAAAVERIKKLRPPDSELLAEAERTKKMKFASSKKADARVETAADEAATEAESKRIRPAGKEPKVLAVKSNKLSPKVLFAVGIPVALGVLYFALRAPVANNFVTAADRDFAHHDNAKALSGINSALLIDPGNGEAHFLKGQILAAQNQREKAYAAYVEALNAKPNDPDILRAYIFLARKLKKYEQVKTGTENLISHDPVAATDGYWYGMLGQALDNMGDHKGAATQYTKSLELGLKTPWIYSGRAWSQLYAGNLKLALRDFDLAMNSPKDLDKADALIGKAQVLTILHDYKGALDCCDSALKLSNKLDYGYFRRASIYIAMNDFGKAMQDYDQVLKFDPNSLPAHIGKSDLYSKMGKTDLAFKELNGLKGADADFARAALLMKTGDVAHAASILKGVLDKDHQNAYKFMDLAYCYARLKKFPEAINACESALAIQPKNASFRALHGLYNRMLSQPVSARSDFDKALALDPNNAEAHLWRGEMFAQAGDMLAARQDFERAAALNPNFAAARDRIRRADEKYLSTTTGGPQRTKMLPLIEGNFEDLLKEGYAKLKKRDATGAVQYLASAVRQNPNSVEARRYLAYGMTMRGDTSEAISQLNALVAMPSSSANDLLSLADLLMKADRTEEALGFYTKIVASDPHNKAARCAMANAYSVLNRIPEAVQVCLEGEVADPNSAPTFAALAKKIRNGEGPHAKIAAPTTLKPSG